ncbi:MAG: hypothetical protein JKX92_05095 [Porticoccaceae bacterium]|nr:hypothetical protein [Porticoccaceae bacterium]
MTKLSETEEGVNWIAQFRVDDQVMAGRLLDALKLVSHDEFIEQLKHRILDTSNKTEGVIALFTEREVRKGKNRVPNRLYKEPYRKRGRRAYGMGPQPVKPTNNYKLIVGSEGIVSWLISEICMENPNKFISHPSPDQIRKKKVRKFVLVTDIIGSGNRVYEYLESAWRVASVRSWRSLKYVSFGVVAYTGTEAGIKTVKSHQSKTTVDVVIPCPTITTEFDDITSSRIKEMCIYCDPVDNDRIESLGYKGSGALIAFYHGCPNNAPRLLHKPGKRSWKPIFSKRRTSAQRHIFSENDNDAELRKLLERMHETRLQKGYWIPAYSKEGRKILILLAALRRGPRFSEALARKTGLTIPEIEILLEKATQWGWVSETRLLMEAGKGQLAHARKITVKKEKIDQENNLYYPKSLRAPTIASS